MADMRAWEGVRVRIQRMKDARFFGGWLISSRGDIVNIRLSQPATFLSADDLVLEAMGYQSAVVKASCVSCVGDLLTVHLMGEPIGVPSREPMRMVAEPMEGRLIVRSILYPFTVVDIGLEGLGILCERGFDRGDEARFEMQSPRGLICGEATVRFSQRTRNGIDGHRVGLKLERFDARSASLWHELFRPAA